MIKLLIFTTELDYGGAEKFILRLTKELLNYDIKISICCIARKTEIINYQLDKKIKLLELQTSLKKSLPKIIRTINFEKPNIVFSILWPLNSIVAIAKIFSKHNFKLILRDGNPYIPKAASDFKLPLFLIKLIVSFTYFLSDQIISISKGNANNLNKFSLIDLRKKNKVIYNFVDTNRVININQKDNKLISILALGKFRPQKDFETIIYSMNELKKYINFKLHIVGDGPKRKSLEELVDKLHLNKCIIFYGIKDNIYELIDQSDFFIHSSHYDGLPNAVLEAMNSKIKIIATDCNYGPREILDNGKYGKLVKVGDFKQISQEIINNINININYEDRKKWIKKFSIENITKNYYETILQVFNK